MKKALTLASFLVFGCAIASSEIVIRTKDGKTFRVPVAASEIASIEFTASQEQKPTQILTGKWIGTFRNSLGDSGSTTLVFTTNSDGISGTLDGDPFRNALWDGTTLRWSYTAKSSNTTYRCEFQFTGSNTGKLSYTANGSKSYSGSVSNYVRQ